MKNLKTDFGANKYKKGCMKHIHPYFLCFIKVIIKKAMFQGFFYIIYIFNSSVISDKVLS